MTEIFATGDEAFVRLAGGAAWLAAGALVGALHFLTLRRSAQMLAAGTSLPVMLALHLTRFAITAGVLTITARHGALPLLAATLGILASRIAVLRADVGCSEPHRDAVAGLVPATPNVQARSKPIGVAGTGAATTRGGHMTTIRSGVGAPR